MLLDRRATVSGALVDGHGGGHVRASGEAIRWSASCETPSTWGRSARDAKPMGARVRADSQPLCLGH